MTTEMMTETLVKTFSNGIAEVELYRGLLGWTVQLQILGDKYHEIYTDADAAIAAFESEVLDMKDREAGERNAAIFEPDAGDDDEDWGDCPDNEWASGYYHPMG